MRKSDSTKNLDAALLKFQDEVDPILKDAANPHFKSKYAKLESCIAIARPALAKHNLVVTQPTSFVDGIVILHTRIVHTSSGEWLETDWPLIPAKSDPQGMGSANTYGRRYNYLSALGLSAEDDDGNGASAREEKPAQRLRAAPPTPREETIERMGVDESAGDYVIPFGKHKGKSIAEIGLPVATKYADWIKDDAQQKGKPIGRDAGEFIRHVAAYAVGVPVPDDSMETIPF